jgi:hypothetical protein
MSVAPAITVKLKPKLRYLHSCQIVALQGTKKTEQTLQIFGRFLLVVHFWNPN